MENQKPKTDTERQLLAVPPPPTGSAWRYDEPQQQDGQMCCTLRGQVAVPRGDLFHGGWTYESWKLIRAGMPWMTIEDAEKYNDDHGPIPQPNTKDSQEDESNG